MNSCNFVGRLTAEIELRRTNNGKAVASYSLAVKRPRVADTTDFIEFVSWEQGAEYLSKYAHKGDVVAACGTLQPRKWTDKDGNNRTAWEVVTTSVELLSSKKNNEGSTQATQNQNGFQGSYSQPQQSYSGPQQGYEGTYYHQWQHNQPPQGGFAPIEGDDPKLPF